jgi:large subunit ribosomal protein L28
MNIGFVQEFARALCKRSQRGLYGGKKVMFGNNVSDSGRRCVSFSVLLTLFSPWGVFFPFRTRRIFRPNVQSHSFWSDVLNRKLSFQVTTYALRCVDKAGGIDNYLLNTADDKLDSEIGLVFKRKIRKALREREALTASILDTPGGAVTSASVVG